MIGAASLAEAGAAVFTARVLAGHVRQGRQRLRVRAVDGGEAFEALALRQAGPEPRPGDEVLVLRSPEGDAWIVGVIGGEVAPARRVQEPGGAAVELVEDDAGMRLRVRGRSGALLFEHDPDTGRSTACVSEGDLSLAVAKGDLSLAAEGRLRLDADSVSIIGRREVSVAVDDAGAGPSGRSRLDLGPERMRLAAHRLSLVARDTHLLSGLARVSVDSLELGARCASAAFTTVEVAADRLRQRVHRSYSYVKDLLHVRAGRSWTEVTGALRLRGGTAALRARGRVKVDGESVHLG